MNEIPPKPVKYFGRYLDAPAQHWAEVDVVIYTPRFHSVLEIWCVRIHAPTHLESDTFVMDETANAALRRAASYVASLDLGLTEISKSPKYTIEEIPISNN